VSRQAWPRTVLGATESEFFGRRRVWVCRARIVAHSVPWGALVIGAVLGVAVMWMAAQVWTVTVR
jgi:hypothetical protein